MLCETLAISPALIALDSIGDPLLRFIWVVVVAHSTPLEFHSRVMKWDHLVVILTSDSTAESITDLSSSTFNPIKRSTCRECQAALQLYAKETI